MKQILTAVVAGLLVSYLAACGVRPTGVTGGGEAPTGVAPGVTLYFLDAHDRLTPQVRKTGRLGTISDAMTLLLSGPGAPGLHTGITAGTTRVVVTTGPGLIQLRVPLSADEVTALGIDQIVCTALGVNVQSGGSPSTQVRLLLTIPTPGSGKLRSCPLGG